MRSTPSTYVKLFDEILKLSDIVLPEGVSIPALAQGEEADRAVVSIHIIKEVVIEEEEEVAEGEVPLVDGEEAPAEAEAPAADEGEDSDGETTDAGEQPGAPFSTCWGQCPQEVAHRRKSVVGIR